MLKKTPPGMQQSLVSLSAVILLPLWPVSLTYKNPLQRRKIIHEMHPIGCKKKKIDLKIFLVVPGISCLCDFCGCCLKMHIYVSPFCASSI